MFYWYKAKAECLKWICQPNVLPYVRAAYNNYRSVFLVAKTAQNNFVSLANRSTERIQ